MRIREKATPNRFGRGGRDLEKEAGSRKSDIGKHVT